VHFGFVFQLLFGRTAELHT